MALISILLSLALEKFGQQFLEYRKFNWAKTYIHWVWKKIDKNKIGNSLLGASAVILPIIAVLWIISNFLWGIFTPLGFIFDTAILFYSLGPKNLHNEINYYLNEKQLCNTKNAAVHMDKIFGQFKPENENKLNQTLVELILVETHERLLAVIFWFLVLGPVGAILFRLAYILQEITKAQPYENSKFADAAQQIYTILGWLPSRLVALSYAISGSFVHTMENWRNHEFKLNDHHEYDNKMLLTRAGLGALQIKTTGVMDNNDSSIPDCNTEQVRNALSLAWRSIVTWITVISLMTLLGWFN